MYGKIFSDQTWQQQFIRKMEQGWLWGEKNAVYSYQNKKRNETHKSAGTILEISFEFTRDMHKQPSAA